MALLKNVNLKILNIHSGIIENDIIKFKQKIKVNIWIFFDGINIYNSMGLIMEIMINYSIKGNFWL